MTSIFLSPAEAGTTVKSVFLQQQQQHRHQRPEQQQPQRGSRNAPLLFEKLRQFSSLENREAREVVHDLLQISHFNFP